MLDSVAKRELRQRNRQLVRKYGRKDYWNSLKYKSDMKKGQWIPITLGIIVFLLLIAVLYKEWLMNFFGISG